jgi:Sugar-transfer associated ATP-grasp
LKLRSLPPASTDVRYLGETAKAGAFDIAGAMQRLAAEGGPGPLRQALTLLALSAGRRKIRPEEYYTYALWRADRGRAFQDQFLSNRRIRVFNASLKMPARGVADDTINDKVATEAILAARGLPVAATRALYLGSSAPATLPGLRTLHSASDIEAFLSDPANLPVFGKPRADSFARGAAVITGHGGTGTVRFLTGQEVPIAGLAAEIVQDWGQGYMFQPFYQCEASLRRHVGAAMASVRIVTLLTDRGVEPWYAVIRLPAKTAMHDGDADDTRIWGLIDIASGKIVKLRSLREPQSPDLTHGNDPAAEFLGFQMPDWDRALDICRTAHDSFPGNGCIGWDVFLTDEGPLLNEANGNPGHLYQVAAQRPLLNPDMRPTYDRAVAFAKKHGGGVGAF